MAKNEQRMVQRAKAVWGAIGLVAVLLGGCLQDLGEIPPACGDGQDLRVEAANLCVYSSAIVIETGFQCPQARPYQSQAGDNTVCSDVSNLPASARDEAARANGQADQPREPRNGADASNGDGGSGNAANDAAAAASNAETASNPPASGASEEGHEGSEDHGEHAAWEALERGGYVTHPEDSAEHLEDDDSLIAVDVAGDDSDGTADDDDDYDDEPDL